jgi:transmembrane sensor
MSANHDSRENRLIAEQAAQWVCDLRATSPQQQAQLMNWLKRSPRHVREFLFAATLWREAADAVSGGHFDVEQLIAKAAGEGPGQVIALNESAPVSTPTRRRESQFRARSLPVAAALGALAVASTLGWWFLSEARSDRIYHTAVGEQRAIRLPDGSVMHLNTDSRVETDYSATARSLRLIKGEALFTVERDPTRPFSVRAGETVVRALGTQFNVYLRSNETRVSVLDGRVSVNERITLPAGEEAAIAPDGQVAKHGKVDIGSAITWRERRLVFRGRPLADVAEEFNRYNPRQIRVEGRSARERLLSGTFDADDPGALILFVQKLEDLSVQEQDREIVIRSLVP